MNHKSVIVLLSQKMKGLLNFSFSQNAKLICTLLIFVMGVWVVFSFQQLKNLSTTYSMRQFLPKNDPLLIREDFVKKAFKLQETPGFLVAMSLPKDSKISWLNQAKLDLLGQTVNEISNIKIVKKVLALSNAEGIGQVGGALTVGSLVHLTSPKTRAKRILKDPLLTPALLSKDAMTTMLIIDTGFRSAEVLTKFETEIRGKLEKTYPEASIQIGGVLAIQTDIGNLLLKELRNFILLAFIISLLTLMIIFSNVSGILVPLIIIGCANIVVLGGMAFFRVPFTVVSTTIPILVNITVLAIATHTMLRMDEEAKLNPRQKLNPFGFTVLVLKTLYLPNLLAALTTCVGFFTLATINVPLIKQYGMATAISIMGTWLFTNMALLALLPLIPIPRARNWTSHRARWSLRVMIFKTPLVIGITLASLLLAVIGTKLNWSPRHFDDLPEDHPTRVATELMDGQLGGVMPLELVISSKTQNAWNDPKFISKLDHVLKEIRTFTGVGSAVGLPDLLNTAQNSNHKTDINSRKSIAETYFIYSLAPNSPIEHFLTGDGSTTRIAIRMKDLPAQQIFASVNKIDHLAKMEFPNLKVYSTGLAINSHKLNERLSKNLIFGFWQALLIIGLMLALVFRSLRWSLVACVPNFVPPMILIGVLSLTHMPIKPGIALVFTIALGLSFNNTVYLLERIRNLKKTRGYFGHRVRRAFYLESNPCVVSTLVIFAGFIVFLGSYFSLNRNFGVFMLLSILGGLLGDLVFLPALLSKFPKLLSGTPDPVDLTVTPLLEEEFKPAVAAAVVLMCLLGGSTLYGSELSSQDILNRAEKQITTRDELAHVKLKIIESNGSSKIRVLEIKRKSGSKNYVLARLDGPSDLRGTAFLSIYSGKKEDQWLYLPSSKETRRIVGGNKQSGFLGSEISYEDLSATSAEGARTKILRKETIKGHPYAVLETRSKSGNSSYSSVHTWISLDGFLALKAEYFNLKKHLVKTISFNNYKQFANGVWRAQLVKVKNTETNRRTDLILTDLNVNKNISESEFTVRAMEVD